MENQTLFEGGDVARKLRGRPRKENGEVADRMFVIRMTGGELAELDALAKREGLTKAAFIKKSIRAFANGVWANNE